MLRVFLAWAHLAVAISGAALNTQTSSKSPSVGGVATPSAYLVSFERHEAIQGVSSTPAVTLPFRCAPDGDMFIRFASTAPPGVIPPPLPSFQVVSISLSGVPHSFLLEQVPDVHIVSEIDYYAYDSGVVFLVKATRNNIGHDVGKDTPAERAAAQRSYIISFDRDGKYQRTFEPGAELRIQHLAVFPSGTFLVFGYDPNDHAPKLAMLKEDGSYLKSLDLPRGAMPKLAIGTEGGKRGVLIAVELVRAGSSVMVIQPQSQFPILEVSQGGVVRALDPKLPSGTHIADLIPSDGNIFALVDTELNPSSETVYELQPQDGSIVRTLTMSNQGDGAAVSCVHDGSFCRLIGATARLRLWSGRRNLPTRSPRQIRKY